MSAMDRLALKVQRRCFAQEAIDEITVYQRLRELGEPCPEIIGLREAFLYDGHICMAFDRHGNSLCEALERGPIRPARVRQAARQILTALVHLHRAGYTHTDIKPDNILYRPRSGEARLADLGDAEKRLRQGTLYGTREYTAPEMILGAPLQPSLDIWSLGCTIFEMLTDQLLFDSRAAAAKKYHEFSQTNSDAKLPLSPSAIKDMAEEESEQLAPRTVITGKYRLEHPLGRGRFGTVWAAVRIKNARLDDFAEILQRGGILPPRVRQTERQRRDRRWRHKKGADDVVDLALNYEQVLLTAALCGPFPTAMVKSARFRDSYFAADGALRFRPALRKVSLRDRLRRASPLRNCALTLATDFLSHCLTIDPTERITAVAALSHPWLANGFASGSRRRAR